MNINMALLDAVINDDLELTKQLLEAGADPNYYEDFDHIRPLFFAASNNSFEIVMLLVTAGAIVDVRSVTDDMTPMDVADMLEFEDMVELLARLMMQQSACAH